MAEAYKQAPYLINNSIVIVHRKTNGIADVTKWPCSVYKTQQPQINQNNYQQAVALSLYLTPLFGMLYLTTLEIPLFPLTSSKAI